MASTALVSILSQIAPEAASIIEQLKKAKVNDREIMLSLLALNLEQIKKTECVSQQIRDLRSDMVRKGSAV